MTSTILNQINVHIPITPLLLFFFGVLLFAIWAIFSVIAHYHWKNYSTSKIEVIKMTLIYFVGSAILLALIGVFAFMYMIPVN